MTFRTVRNELRHLGGKQRTQAVLNNSDGGQTRFYKRAQKTALRQPAEGEPYDTAKVVRSSQNIGSTYQGVAPSTGNPGASGDQTAPIVTPELNYCAGEYREGLGQGFIPHPPSLVTALPGDCAA
jgi:hypothetical protein